MGFDIREEIRKAEEQVKVAQAKRDLLAKLQEAMNKREAASRATSEKRLACICFGTKVSKKRDETKELHLSIENTWNRYELKRNQWIQWNRGRPEYLELIQFVTNPGSRHEKTSPFCYMMMNGLSINLPPNLPNEEKVDRLRSANELRKQLSTLLEEKLAIEKLEISETAKNLELSLMLGAWQAAEKDYAELVANEARSKAELVEAWQRWQQGSTAVSASTSTTSSKRSTPEISFDDENIIKSNPSKKTRLSTRLASAPSPESKDALIISLHNAWAQVRDTELFVFCRTTEIRQLLHDVHRDCRRLMNILDWAEKLDKYSKLPGFGTPIEGTKFYDLLMKILKRGKLWSTERFSGYLDDDQEGRGRYKAMKAEFKAATARSKQFNRL